MIRAVSVLLLSLVAWIPVAADPATEVPEILLSRQLLEAQGIRIGQIVRLSRDPDGGDARDFRVVGTYEPVPDPHRLTETRWEARLHLGDLLELRRDPATTTTAETVDRINVLLRDPGQVDAVALEIGARAPGLVAGPTRGSLEAGPFTALERFHEAIAAVTVLGSTAFLLSLMIIRSEERRETAGILRLLGFSRSRIVLEVFVEGLFIALFGAVVGLLLALVLESAFNRFFQWYYDTALVFVRVTPAIAVRCVAVAVPLGLFAAVAASWTLVRHGIMRLLRR